ncbi:hypothetical protein HDU89_007049 [Geranomyces variabilis]|nr:hypothetical protein HDU89_007049 [Geranomyces variabilis]
MPSTTFKTLTYSVADGIATITFNRPSSLNAITLEMYMELPVALKLAGDDKSTMVTVLTGNGRFFSSGADVTETPREPAPPLSDTSATRAYYRRRWDATIAPTALAAIDHPKVLVAALNGPVVGVAAALVAHADMIYVADTATLHAPFVQLGISPEAGSSFALLKRMGHAKGMEALLLAKKFTAQELLDCGFANEIFPTDGFHTKVQTSLATAVRAAHPSSLVVTKQLVHAPFKKEQRTAVYAELDELTERFVSGDPQKVFAALAAKYAKKSKL